MRQRRINDFSLLERGMRNMDMKDYRAMKDKASIGERIAFIIFAMAFLVTLSHMTERDILIDVQPYDGSARHETTSKQG